MQLIEQLRNFYNILYSTWHQPLLTIADHKIEFSNLISAIFLIFVAIYYKKSFFNWLDNKLINRLDTDQHTINILQNLLFYIIFILFSLVVLQIANIPITVFAFIGGALAISLGLGAQNFINNFISSLIVMFEKPFKIGDIVQFGEIFGVVKSIGMRNTTLVNPSEVEILIPNTTIINNTLVNWTATDRLIKYKMVLKTTKNNKDAYNQAHDMMNKLKQIISSVPSIIKTKDCKVQLIKIEETAILFLIEFYTKIPSIDIFQTIKNQLNLVLLKELTGLDFSMEYMDTELKKISVLYTK